MVEIVLMRPIGMPFGNTRSPPDESTRSPTSTFSSLMMLRSSSAPLGVPRTIPCRRDFSSIAPTPLNWSLISSTCAVLRSARMTLPTTPSGVITAASDLMPSFEPLSSESKRD